MRLQAPNPEEGRSCTCTCHPLALYLLSIVGRWLMPNGYAHTHLFFALPFSMSGMRKGSSVYVLTRFIWRLHRAQILCPPPIALRQSPFTSAVTCHPSLEIPDIFFFLHTADEKTWLLRVKKAEHVLLGREAVKQICCSALYKQSTVSL